jgi:hypothetical protein
MHVEALLVVAVRPGAPVRRSLAFAFVRGSYIPPGHHR